MELIFLHVATLYSSNHLEAHGKLFRFVHQRLHEIKHVFDKAFDRVNILECGDLSQLKPIGSSWNNPFGRVNILACGDLSQLKPIGSSWRLLCLLLGRMDGCYVGWQVRRTVAIAGGIN